MLRFLVLGFLALCLHAQDTTKEDVRPYEDVEAYNVYSAVLAMEKSHGGLLIGDITAGKTLAFVEMDVVCGWLCGHGNPYVLEKKKGKWVEYSPPLIENPDGTIKFPAITACMWDY